MAYPVMSIEEQNLFNKFFRIGPSRFVVSPDENAYVFFSELLGDAV